LSTTAAYERSDTYSGALPNGSIRHDLQGQYRHSKYQSCPEKYSGGKRYLKSILTFLALTIECIIEIRNGGAEFLPLSTPNIAKYTFVPAVGAYSRDSGRTSMLVGLDIALGISPVSGAPCDVRLFRKRKCLTKVGPFRIIIRKPCHQFPLNQRYTQRICSIGTVDYTGGTTR
jgi:hypothetical protein